MHFGGYQVREYYVQLRREMHPGYRPDRRAERIWDEVADFICKNGCDPRLYIEAAFRASPGGRFPYPNMLKSYAALDWYREYVRDRLAGDTTISPEVVDNRKVTNEELQGEKYKTDWHHYERYIQQQLGQGFSLKEILLSSELPLAAWFRVLYTIPPAPEVRSAYYETAKAQVLGNRSLQEVLKEKGICVQQIFY